MLISACGSQPPDRNSTTITNRAPQAVPATSEVHADRPGDMGRLVAVRLARNDGFDRLVLQFAAHVPSYRIGYRSLPAYADGSGFEIPLPGASTFVQISLIGATGTGWIDGPQTYFGSSTVTANTAVVTEAKAAGDFEAVLNWVVGLRTEAPFSVSVQTAPPRLVIDFVH